MRGSRTFAAALKIEDAGLYFEPPKWYYPIRQSLGAALLKAGKPAEAEAVYREDLKRFPENGWSLFGLAAALKAQGKSADAAAVDQRFTKAWTGGGRHADGFTVLNLSQCGSGRDLPAGAGSLPSATLCTPGTFRPPTVRERESTAKSLASPSCRARTSSGTGLVHVRTMDPGFATEDARIAQMRA